MRARPLNLLAWTALVMSPLLLVIELSGPRWLNLTLRGLWVALVAVIAAIAAMRVVRLRRAVARRR